MRKFSLIFVILCFLIALDAAAENGSIKYKDKEYTIVDELVESELYPEKVSILVEESLGMVRKYPAISVSYADALTMSKNEKFKHRHKWQLGGLYNLSPQIEEVSFSFILADQYSSFAATPIKKARKEDLKDNSLSIEEIKHETAMVQKELLKQVEELEKAEEELKSLEKKAKESRDIGNIVSLKMELEKLNTFSGSSKSEIDRLTSLIKTGRVWKDKSGLRANRKILQDQLRDAAEITSINLRLNKRKRKAAINQVKQKINLVKANKNVDTDELSKKLWKLKRKRKELESRLGLNEIGQEVVAE